MAQCPIKNDTVENILARDVLQTFPYNYIACYEKFTLDELKDVMKIVFDKTLRSQANSKQIAKIRNHEEVLTGILRKKLTKNIQNSKNYDKHIFTSNNQRSLDESVKQIMESISSNRLLDTKPDSPRSIEPVARSSASAATTSTTAAASTAITAKAIAAPVPTNSKLIRITRDKNGIFHKEIVHGSNPKSIPGESRLFRLTRDGGTYKIEQVREQSIAPLSKTSGGKRKKTHKRSHRQ